MGTSHVFFVGLAVEGVVLITGPGRVHKVAPAVDGAQPCRRQ
jgi:hypothetical protein